MDNRGQMILLSALAVCLCLIMVTGYLISVEDAGTMDAPQPGCEILENVIWAQDAGLKDIAGATGDYPWDRRQDMVDNFRGRCDRLADDIASGLLSRGIAYAFEYNNTLAAEYAARFPEAGLTAESGIVIRKNGSAALVCGCAYDASITDGTSFYRQSRIACRA